MSAVGFSFASNMVEQIHEDPEDETDHREATTAYNNKTDDASIMYASNRGDKQEEEQQQEQQQLLQQHMYLASKLISFTHREDWENLLRYIPTCPVPILKSLGGDDDDDGVTSSATS